jgi:ABC-type amino acid transport substrate-binding protein
MFATASGRRHVRFRPLEVPDVWPAAAVIVTLGLLLFAGGGPLRSALATFALGTAGVIGALWLRGAVARHRARRRAEASHAALIAGTASRLRTAVGDHELAVALDVLTGGPLGPPRSVAAIAREVAAATRSAGVPVALAVDHDATVAGLDGAIRALVRRAAAQGAVGVAVTTGRVEVRDEGSATVTGFDGELAGGLARRAGAEVHVFEGLAVLELPARRAG